MTNALERALSLARALSHARAGVLEPQAPPANPRNSRNRRSMHYEGGGSIMSPLIGPMSAQRRHREDPSRTQRETAFDIYKLLSNA